MTNEDLTTIDGVGPAIADELEAAGYETVADVENASVDDLADVRLLGESSARDILNDEDDGSSRGRPSKLEDHEDDILTGARQGMTLEGCARLAGVDEATLHRWKNEYEEFRKSLKRARAQGELQHLQTVNDAGSRFLLERSFGYVKTEKREVDASHDHDHEHEHEYSVDEETEEIIAELSDDLRE